MPITNFDMYYVLIMSDGMGNSTFSDNETYWLKEIQKALSKKYGEADYRVKFLKICVMKSETNEFDIQDREWVRYILHEESEPDDQHKRLLRELEEKMK